MYLQQLVIQGFKSFANKTTLNFTPGVTAIVGPNGSGKSNTADAVRWVLGEQSLKSLRGKKSGDVIFAGSDKKARLGFCQVDMHLNNEDHKAPVDYSEIIITRKLFRDGEGEYYINKHRVRLHDILMLLAKSNFGQRSYSIIGQGTVDLFLSATPSQRKEYFDEAAGVRQFQIKKEQAENKLRQTAENLKQAELLMQEIRPRLNSLTRQVHRLEKREEIKTSLKKIQYEYYSGLWHDFKKQYRSEKETLNKIKNEKNQAKTELESIHQKMQQLAVGSSRQEEYNLLRQKYDQINQEKNKLLKEQAILKGKIELGQEQAGNTDIAWLGRKKDELRNKLNSIKNSLENEKVSWQKFQSQQKFQEQELEKINEEQKKISFKLKQAKNQLSKKEAPGLMEISQRINNIYRRQKSLAEKIESAQTPEDIKTLKSEAKDITSQLEQLNQKLGNAGKTDPFEMLNWQDKLNELMLRKDEALNSLNSIKLKSQISQEKIALEQQSADELEKELNKIEKEISRSQNSWTAEELKDENRQEIQKINKKLSGINVDLEKINNEIKNFNQSEQKKKEEVFKLQNEFSKKQDQINEISSKLNEIKIKIAKVETKLEDLEKEMLDEMDEEERNKIYSNNQPPAANPELFSEIQKLKRQIELIGGIDPQVSEEYKETKERYEFLSQQSEDLIKASKDLKKAIANLEETIKKQFRRAFEQINKQFTQYFKILFNGGNASLSLIKENTNIENKSGEPNQGQEGEENNENTKPLGQESGQSEKPAEKVITGIDIHATPPGKKLRGISMLSGGERALTSIALICAIIHHNPSPFVILDEVDAALDESNSIRFASIIDRLSKKTQFIVITHNRATMEKAHTLYGVTMGDDGISRLLSINMEEAEKVINKQ